MNVAARHRLQLATSVLALAVAAACHHPPPAETPEAAFWGLRHAAAKVDERAARRFVTTHTLELMRDIQTAAAGIHASNVPANVLDAFLQNFGRQAPELTGSEPKGGDETVLVIRYQSGHPGRLTFRREEGTWRLDLTQDLEPSLALLNGAKARLDALARGEIIQGDADD